MPDTKLDADLAAYEERHLKLEHAVAALLALCDLCEKLPKWHQMRGKLTVDDVRDALKEVS